MFRELGVFGLNSVKGLFGINMAVEGDLRSPFANSIGGRAKK